MVPYTVPYIRGRVARDLPVSQAMEAWHRGVGCLKRFFIHHIGLTVGERSQLRVE